MFCDVIQLVRWTKKSLGTWQTDVPFQFLLFSTFYILSTLKWNENGTLLLNTRLQDLQIYCCVVGVNKVATGQRFRISVQLVQKAATEFWTNIWLNLRLQIFRTEDNWKDETVGEECMAWAFFVTALSIDAVFFSTLKNVQDNSLNYGTPNLHYFVNVHFVPVYVCSFKTDWYWWKELGCGDVIYQILRLFGVACFVRNCVI